MDILYMNSKSRARTRPNEDAYSVAIYYEGSNCFVAWRGIDGFWGSWGRFKNTYELLNLRAPKFSPVNKIDIFQCMGMILCMEFHRYPLKFSKQNILPIH